MRASNESHHRKHALSLVHSKKNSSGREREKDEVLTLNVSIQESDSVLFVVSYDYISSPTSRDPRRIEIASSV